MHEFEGAPTAGPKITHRQNQFEEMKLADGGESVSGFDDDSAGDVVSAVSIVEYSGTQTADYADETDTTRSNGRIPLSPLPGINGRLARIPWAKIATPIHSVGEFFAMALDTLMCIPRRPFAWREFLLQSWFVARVSLAPTLMLAVPFAVLMIFTFNILMIEFGAADYSGSAAAYGTVTQIGPVVTVLVVSGAGATAMCADLGARTIREEIDALRVLGIDPIQALVVPRVLAATSVAVMLASTVMITGLVGGFFFTVYFQHVAAGAFVAGLTTLTGTADVIVSLVKATLFGMAAGLIACYKGISVGGGPAGVGNAVNETVVFTFMVLFAINVIVTAVGIQFTVS